MPPFHKPENSIRVSFLCSLSRQQQLLARIKECHFRVLLNFLAMRRLFTLSLLLSLLCLSMAQEFAMMPFAAEMRKLTCLPCKTDADCGMYVSSGVEYRCLVHLVVIRGELVLETKHFVLMHRARGAILRCGTTKCCDTLSQRVQVVDGDTAPQTSNK